MNYGTRNERVSKKLKKSVKCIITGEIFECIQDASKKYNVSQTGITQCCRGQHKSAGKLDENKLIWQYAS